MPCQPHRDSGNAVCMYVTSRNGAMTSQHMHRQGRQRNQPAAALLLLHNIAIPESVGQKESKPTSSWTPLSTAAGHDLSPAGTHLQICDRGGPIEAGSTAYICHYYMLSVSLTARELHGIPLSDMGVQVQARIGSAVAYECHRHADDTFHPSANSHT